MRRHDISFFSLIAGLLFGSVAVMLIATDGRFPNASVPFGVIAIVAAGVMGAGLVAAGIRSIAVERRAVAADMGAGGGTGGTGGGSGTSTSGGSGGGSTGGSDPSDISSPSGSAHPLP